MIQIIAAGRRERYHYGKKDIIMLACPLCDEQLQTKTPGGWLCRCGEMIPFGMEKDDEENCSNCLVMNCPRRK
jgi:hypothetical protein